MTVRIYRVTGGWGCRIRCGAELRPRLSMPDLPEAEAQSRADRMAAMAQSLSAVGKAAECKVILERAAAAKTEAMFREAESAAREVVASSEVAPRERVPKTFRDVADLWTTGQLHRRFPDRVARKDPRGASLDRSRLEVLCRSVGSVAIVKFTVEDAERALSELPRTLGPATRRSYAKLVGRVLKLAAFPCRLIERSPLPEGWTPRPGPSSALQFLYPDEEAALMGCRRHISIGRRLTYGFMSRNGCRVSEVLRMVWADFDLERGVVRLDKNKTKRPRAWKLDDDVCRALRRWRLECTTTRVFGELPLGHAARTFRADLDSCRVGRPELHERAPGRRPIRVHDLRATFVTVAMAAGKTEGWIMSRTGHATSSMLAKYHRQADVMRESGVTWFGPLDQLLWPGQDRAREAILPAGMAGPRSSERTPKRHEVDENQPETAVVDPPTGTERHTGPAGFSGAGQTTDRSLLAVEEALALALEAAVKAGRLDLVPGIVAELGERRRARTAPEVTSLEQARRRKDGER